jgi:hypothetical protein
MEQKSIASIIFAFTKYVRENLGGRATDLIPGHPIDTVGLAAWQSEVKSVCDDMDELAQNPDSRFADFETLRQKMDDFPSTPPDLLAAVADAFQKAGRLDAKK